MSIENITIDEETSNFDQITAEFITTDKHNVGIGLKIDKPLIATKLVCSFDIRLEDIRLMYGIDLATEEGED